EDGGTLRRSLLQPVVNPVGGVLQPDARRALARECYGTGLEFFQLYSEANAVIVLRLDFCVHPCRNLAKVSKANSVVQQPPELLRIVEAWGQSNLIQGAPEPIAGMGVVRPDLRRGPPSCGADENNVQVRREQIGK